MKIPFIYFVTTQNCNYSCKHCYLEAGPRKKNTTISEKDFRMAIKNINFPKYEIVLSGGELYSVYNDFRNFLGIIKKEKKSKEIDLSVQTNGFWAVNDRITKKRLEELAEFKVDGIDIASKDKYHFEQGLNKKNLQMIRDVNFMYKFIPDITFKGVREESEIFPVGRARNITNFEKFYHVSYSCENSLEDLNLNVDFLGNVYMCCFRLYQLPGNLIEEPLKKIVSRARKDSSLMRLNKEGIRGIAKLKGMKRRETEEIVEAHGTCGLCARLNGLF